MIVKTPFVRPIIFLRRAAFRAAQEHYLKVELTNEKGEKVTFEDDLLWAFNHGWIYSSPSSFAIAWVINISEEEKVVTPAWFIRYAVGNFHEIIKQLPFKFEFIQFCRDNEGGGTIFHRWKTERLLKLAQRARTVTGASHERVQAGSTPAAAKKIQVQ